jgi:hypothetical protein
MDCLGANNADNKDAFFVRAPHYKCACYGERYVHKNMNNRVEK